MSGASVKCTGTAPDVKQGDDVCVSLCLSFLREMSKFYRSPVKTRMNVPSCPSENKTGFQLKIQFACTQCKITLFLSVWKCRYPPFFLRVSLYYYNLLWSQQSICFFFFFQHESRAVLTVSTVKSISKEFQLQKLLVIVHQTWKQNWIIYYNLAIYESWWHKLEMDLNGIISFV